jgi:hypothetical protein
MLLILHTYMNFMRLHEFALTFVLSIHIPDGLLQLRQVLRRHMLVNVRG